ncbi:MAG TPA: amidohydrolase family protein [Thermoanaerobaculia bacterium]
MVIAGCMPAGQAKAPGDVRPPLVDHHQHLLSPALAKVWKQPEPFLAERLIAQLDAAGIQRALVLSLAYVWGSPRLPPSDDEYARVRAENDWTAQQAALYPTRLVAACSVNPLRDYALREIERCATHPGLRNGLKMQFANSGVNLRNAEHVAQLRRVFAAANGARMPLIVHVWTGDEHVGNPFDARDARTFIDQVLPSAPNVVVQIAHLGGSGPRLDPGTEAAMIVLSEAAARSHPAMRNVYFDLATNVVPQSPDASAEFVTARIRQIGVSRVVYGSDGPPNLPAAESWRAHHEKLGLTPGEFEQIRNNVAPSLK